MAQYSLSLLLCVFLYTFFNFSAQVDAIVVDCITNIGIPPLSDCQMVLDALYHQWKDPRKGEAPIAWGRTITKSPTAEHLPVGFRLNRIKPWGPLNKCEIYVDNKVDRWSQIDTFTMLDLIQAGQAVLDQCYPRALSGRAYPAARRNVFVTTLWHYGKPRENTTIVDVDPLETNEINII